MNDESPCLFEVSESSLKIFPPFLLKKNIGIITRIHKRDDKPFRLLRQMLLSETLNQAFSRALEKSNSIVFLRLYQFRNQKSQAN